MKHVIEINGVTKSVKKRLGWFKSTSEDLLKDISLTIDKGEFIVMLGKNGSGKSTLIKCISGMLYPEKGTILVNGMDSFKKRSEVTKKLGILFGQKSLMFTDLRAIDYFHLLKRVYGLSEVEFNNAIEEVHQFLPCKHLLEKQMRGMSYGEKMKMELVSSVLHSPSVLILDEPFVGLDPLSQEQLMRFIQHYKVNKKVTIILTTHQYLEILTLADRAIVLEKGTLTYQGNVEELLHTYLSKKIVKVQWSKPRLQPVLNLSDGIEVLESSETSLKLEICLSRCSVEETIMNLIKLGEISDVDIQSIPIEKVVEELYEKNEIRIPVVS